MRKSGEPSAAVRTKSYEPLMIVVALITNRPASTTFRAANGAAADFRPWTSHVSRFLIQPAHEKSTTDRIHCPLGEIQLVQRSNVSDR